MTSSIGLVEELRDEAKLLRSKSKEDDDSLACLLDDAADKIEYYIDEDRFRLFQQKRRSEVTKPD